jgi:hypothetical protein
MKPLKRIPAVIAVAGIALLAVSYGSAPREVAKAVSGSIRGANGCDCELGTSSCPNPQETAGGCGTVTYVKSWLGFWGNDLLPGVQDGCTSLPGICPTADQGYCPGNKC